MSDGKEKLKSMLNANNRERQINWKSYLGASRFLALFVWQPKGLLGTINFHKIDLVSLLQSNHLKCTSCSWIPSHHRKIKQKRSNKDEKMWKDLPKDVSPMGSKGWAEILCPTLPWLECRRFLDAFLKHLESILGTTQKCWNQWSVYLWNDCLLTKFSLTYSCICFWVLPLYLNRRKREKTWGFPKRVSERTRSK